MAKHFKVLHTDDELLSLATNIGIGRKCLPDTNTNTLAYFAGASETKKKSYCSDFRCVKCHYAKCRYAECRCAKN
jgi:hypothetical protein